MQCESKNMCKSCIDSATPSCICLCVMVNIHGVRQEPSGPSAGLTQPQHLCQAASTNNNCACGYKQGKAHQSTIQNHFKLTGSCSPPQLSQRLFFSHYFLVDPRLVATFNLQRTAVSEYDARWFLSGVLAALGFLLTGFSKSSHSQIAAGLRVHLGSLNVLS